MCISNYWFCSHMCIYPVNRGLDGIIPIVFVSVSGRNTTLGSTKLPFYTILCHADYSPCSQLLNHASDKGFQVLCLYYIEQSCESMRETKGISLLSNVVCVRSCTICVHVNGTYFSTPMLLVAPLRTHCL